MHGLGFYRFSVSLLYYGILFHIPDLSGERHLNFFLGAIVEIISYVLAYGILSRFGRRLPMASFLLVSGVICIAVGALSAVPGKDAIWIGKNIQSCPRVGDSVSAVYSGLKKRNGKLKK
jgi:OCT family organic cation transporter-like MFS transporter 4/5